MASLSSAKTEYVGMMPKALYGRKVIKSDEEAVTRENVSRVVEAAYIEHLRNRSEIEYLYNYYRGKTPIIDRVKEVRPEINHKIAINYANSIVAFKVGYTVGKPIQYVASSPDEAVSKSISYLNDMMRYEGKITKDRKLVEWQMICGTSYRLCLPKPRANERVPFAFYTLDPRNTFIVYANDYTERPLVAVSYKVDEHQNVTFTAYTEDSVFTLLKGGNKAVAEEPNYLNRIPIIEYPLNTARLGVFEIALPILDAINELESCRIDAVDQFVQSLLVLYNCDLDEGVTANQIREAGMILLKNIGENKADVKVISETLNQTDNETLKKSLIASMNEIVGMPTQSDGSSSDSSNNGAVILRNGWQGAETRAEDFEAMFSEPEQKFLDLVSFICDSQNSVSFDVFDVEIHFTRRNYEALLQKSQTLTTLLNCDYVHPQKAYEASGLFVDSEEAYIMGKQFHEERKAEEKAAEPTVEVIDDSII